MKQCCGNCRFWDISPENSDGGCPEWVAKEEPMQDWKKSDLSKVKIGDWVWVNRRGWERVVSVDDDNGSVAVNSGWYHRDGTYMLKDDYPSCFIDCPYPDGPPKPVDRPEFEVGHKVLVRDRYDVPWDRDDVPWDRCYFAEWPESPDDDNTIYVWANGTTEWSSDGDIEGYLYWKDAEK